MGTRRAGGQIMFAGVVGILACICVACGGGGNAAGTMSPGTSTGRNPTRTGTVSGTDGGGLNHVPVFGTMHPAGPEVRSHGVTSRTYVWVGAGPQTAMREYARVMGGTTWTPAVAPHALGTESWQAAWTRAGNTLVVSTDIAPTLQQGSQTSSQLSLLLYPAGTAPSTSPPTSSSGVGARTGG